jgi:hypothetical protein
MHLDECGFQGVRCSGGKEGYAEQQATEKEDEIWEKPGLHGKTLPWPMDLLKKNRFGPGFPLREAGPLGIEQRVLVKMDCPGGMDRKKLEQRWVRV